MHSSSNDMSSPGCLSLRKGNCRTNSSLCPPVLPPRLLHSRNSSRSAGCACQSNAPAVECTSDVIELHPALDHELAQSISEEGAEDEDGVPEQGSPTRRGWLTACLTGLSSAGLHVSSANAFPSPELEGLQESCATSSTRLGQKAGISALRDPAIYRGAATGKAVRRVYSLDGLLPASRFGIQQEIERAKRWIDRCCDPLSKYQALMTLKETNRDAFYGLLVQNVETYLPIVYTPTGSVKGNVRSLVSNWAESDVKVAVLTDGERCLGLGDLGANGLGICVGKSIVHSLGGLHPRHLLPIVVDAGSNTAEVREDELYIGIKQERVRGQQYDQLIDELLEALRERFGTSLLIHWEDFGSQNSYRLLARARAKDYSTFNDDIESTAAAVLAAIFGALRVKGVPPLREQVFVLLGAGQANVGSARLLVRALIDEGLKPQDAKKRIWMFDSKGLLAGRDQNSLSAEKKEFQRIDAESREYAKMSFAQAIAKIKPTALIGATAKQGSFNEESIRNLVKAAEDRVGPGTRPIILALSNPDTQAECTAEEAYAWTDGTAVYASGTTFKPFKWQGKEIVPSQANNSLIFPGVGLGCTASGATSVTEDIMLAAAKAVALKLTEEELSQDSILPATDRLREIALGVAAAVALSAAENMVATSSEIVGCLPKDRDPDNAQALMKAESCIAKLRYDPLFS